MLARERLGVVAGDRQAAVDAARGPAAPTTARRRRTTRLDRVELRPSAVSRRARAGWAWRRAYPDPGVQRFGPSTTSTPSVSSIRREAAAISATAASNASRVLGRRRPVVAHLADELERGGLDLTGRGVGVGAAEGLDASAHARRVPRLRPERLAAASSRARPCSSGRAPGTGRPTGPTAGPITYGPRSMTRAVTTRPFAGFLNVTFVPHGRRPVGDADDRPRCRRGRTRSACRRSRGRTSSRSSRSATWARSTTPAWGGRLDRGRVRAARRSGPLVRIEQDRCRVQRTVGTVRRVKGRSRHLRPTRRHDLNRLEEVWIDHGFGAGAPGSDGSWDGDRGEHGDEHHARDDSGASHVVGNRSRDRRFRPIPSQGRMSRIGVTDSRRCPIRTPPPRPSDSTWS